MRYRLVIFDWDGTLMDSAARIVDCMQAASRDAGWGELPADAIRNIIGLGLPEAIATLCPGIDPGRAELLRSRYAWHFVEGSDTPMRFFSGVEAGVAGLRGRDHQRLAVATGKSRRGPGALQRRAQAEGGGDGQQHLGIQPALGGPHRAAAGQQHHRVPHPHR